MRAAVPHHRSHARHRPWRQWPAQLIELDHNALWHALKKEAFHSTVLEMELAGQATSQVLLRDVQMHPFQAQLVQHVDFQRVDANTRLHEGAAALQRREESRRQARHCLITHVVTELDISCLPADLPEFIAVDLRKGLKKGASLHLDDVNCPRASPGDPRQEEPGAGVGGGAACRGSRKPPRTPPPADRKPPGRPAAKAAQAVAAKGAAPPPSRPGREPAAQKK